VGQRGRKKKEQRRKKKDKRRKTKEEGRTGAMRLLARSR
jgi:hypothetical protein